MANFPTTTLAKPGDFIRLTFQVRLPEVINFGDTFRFGLFHDSGTPARYDQLDAGLLDDDFGYVAAIATGVDSGESHLAGNVAGGNFGSLLGSDELFAPEDAFDEVINDTAPHTLADHYGPGRQRDHQGGRERRRPPRAGRLRSALTFNEVSFGTSPVMGISFILDDVRVVGKPRWISVGRFPAYHQHEADPVGTPATSPSTVFQRRIINVYKTARF